jgi:hypothetical protein
MTMAETRTIADVDVALRTLCQMLTRAVNAPDLPNVRHFLERIDETLEERWALRDREIPMDKA